MIKKNLLREILLDQRETILGKDLGIPREAMKRVLKIVSLPQIVVISGIRRCGKSTLLRQIIKEHFNDEDFFYINFEDERFRDFDSSEFGSLYEEQLSLFGGHKVMMIDEIQNVNGFESFVRRFHDMGFKFFITGSNANLLSRELGTKLTGRYLRIDLKPFSFTEFLDMKEIEHEENDLNITGPRVEIKKAFDEYVEKGGMPEFLKYHDQEILLRTYEDIVFKDIVVRYGLENVRMIRDLYGYLVSNLTNRFTYNSLKKTIGAGSSVTIQNYVNYLEEANFCSILYKYEKKIKMQLIAPKKFYITDHGFLRPISTRLSKEKGKILENIVLGQISQKGDVFYFEGKNECDFIVISGRMVETAIQVTWDLNEETRDREVRGLVEALNNFDLDVGTIITYDQENTIEIDGRRIEVIPLWKWLIRF